MKGKLVPILASALAVSLLAAACTRATPSPTPVPAGQPTAAKPATSATQAPAAATQAPAAANAGDSSYPTKPVTYMIPWPPGDPVDTGSRILLGPAEKYLGQPVAIVNKPGAGSQVGLTEMVAQKPDGYYIGMLNFPRFNTVVLDPSRKANFTLDDFTPIMGHALDPGTIYVKADSPYKSLKDLIDGAKKNPNQVKMGGTSLFSDDHLLILMLQKAAGANFNIVHFEGGAPQLTALLGGHIDVASDNVGVVASRVKTGELRVLAVADKDRSRFLPDVPTMAEAGYPTVLSNSFRAVMGPKGLPAPVLAKLQDVFGKAVKDPAHVDAMEKQGLDVKPMMGDELAKYVKDIHERIKPIFAEALKNSSN